jgi:formate-dependent nitrite reductase membrane component NrfD
MKPEKTLKIEKSVGYALLGLGLALIIVAVILALLVLLGTLHVPELIPTVASEQDAFAQAFAAFSNACLIFFTLVIVVWAGSIVTSRGVTMVKDVRLKFARKSLKEVAEAVEKTENEDV